MPKRTVGQIPERQDISTLSKFYGKISRKIKVVVMELLTENYTEIKAIKTRKEVEALVHRLNVFVSGWVRKSTKDAYRDALKVGIIRMNVLGLKSDPEFDKKIHTRTVEKYREDTFDVFIKSNQSIIENTNALIAMAQAAGAGLEKFQAFDMRDEVVISNLLDEMITEGATRQAAKKAIIAHFQNIIGDGNFININGRNYNIIKYAKMVARTRLRRTQSEATKNLAMQYDNDLVEISDHSTETEICKEFEGNVYSLNGNTPGYDILVEAPPFHPNCMHSMFPTSPEALGLRS